MNLRVLALSHLFPNSIHTNYGIFVFNRLKSLQEVCDIRVIAPLQWYPFRDKLKPVYAGSSKIKRKENIGGLETYYPRFPVIPRYMKWLDAFSYLFSTLAIIKNLRKERFEFDLIDVHWTYPDILAGYVIARLSGKPFLVTIRGLEALYPGERGGRKLLLDWLLLKADAVIALSTELSDSVQKIGVKAAKVHVVLNGVDINNFHCLSRDGARSRLGLPSNKKIIISVGSLIERKGHHEILRIIPDLNKLFDLSFYIIGDINPEGDFSQAIRDMIIDLGLDNVHLVNKVKHSELVDWYNAADLFCLATKGEGCPNVVLEALACGTPVVVTNVGAVPDLVTSGEDGYVVETSELMGSNITEALSRDWDRRGIALKTRGRTWKACAQKVLNIYNSVHNPIGR